MEAIYNNNAEDGEMKSITSERRRDSVRTNASGTTHQRETLREKLTEQHYLTEDEVRNIVLRAGMGCTPESISKLSKSTMDTIKQIEFVDPRKERKDATQVSIGRALYEFCLNMIIPCGESVVTAIKYNYQTNVEMENLSAKKSAVIQDIIYLKQSSVVVHRPDREVYKSRIELKVGKHEAELHHQYHTLYQTRVALQQVQQPGQSTPATSTRSSSRSRGAASQAQQQEQLAAESADASAVVVETWEMSSEHTQYQTELQAFEKKTRLELLDLYVTQQDAWENYESSKMKIEAEILQLEELKMTIQAQELMFQEMRNQITMIVNKVKNAAQSHSFVREKLSKNVVVNNEAIFHPWNTDNLCGIFHILHTDYSTATFELFCTFLMDLLSITATADEIASNPYVVAQRTDAKLKMWLDFKFDEFMTRDHLFTIANLKTLQGDMRKDAMTRVLEKAHQLKLDGDSADVTLEYTDMPLYSALVRYERTVSETTTFQKGKDSTQNRVKSQPTEAGALEQAAAATEVVKKKRVEGRYSREVTRDEELWTAQGKFRYIATFKPCPECSKRFGGEHPKPKCFTGQCKVCGYFGHMAPDCRHTPRPDQSGGGGGQS